MFLPILLQVSLWYVQLRGRESTQKWREHLLPYGTFSSNCLILELQMPVDNFKIKSFSEEVDALYYSPRPIRKQAEQADKGIYILLLFFLFFFIWGIYILKHEKKIRKIFVITRLANWVQILLFPCSHWFSTYMINRLASFKQYNQWKTFLKIFNEKFSDNYHLALVKFTKIHVGL